MKKHRTETHVRSNLQPIPVLLKERSYILASVRIMPRESRFEEFMEFIGEVIRYSLFPR